MNDTSRIKNIPVYIDIICCAVLLPAMIVFMPLKYWFTDNPVFVIVLLLWLYAVYFINRRLSTPLLFQGKKKYWVGLLFILTALVTYGFVRYSVDVAPIPDPFEEKTVLRMRELSVWFMFFIVTCFSFATGFLIELQKRALAQQAIEYEKKKAELALYKAQINPHFLFNTLNTLYGLVISQSEKAEPTFVKFTELLRYMYAKSTEDRTSIGDEIDYISQYIELQQLRLNEHTKVDFTHQEDDTSIEIAPMILITFVENAFKYGTSSHKDSVVSISIRVENGRLLLVTENPIFPGSASNKEGIGINNCRKRLDLLYPGAYSLDILETTEQFKIALDIKLK